MGQTESKGDRAVKRKFLDSVVPALALALLVLQIPAPADGASITITPSSRTATTPGQVIHVLVELNLVGAESMDALQLGLAFSTSQTVFSISPNPLENPCLPHGLPVQRDDLGGWLQPATEHRPGGHESNRLRRGALCWFSLCRDPLCGELPAGQFRPGGHGDRRNTGICSSTLRTRSTRLEA